MVAMSQITNQFEYPRVACELNNHTTNASIVSNVNKNARKVKKFKAINKIEDKLLILSIRMEKD